MRKNPIKTLKEYRELFSDFYTAVKKAHETTKNPHQGHGLDHDVTVAMIAIDISPNKRVAEMTWCAAMVHSIDRIMIGESKDSIKHATKTILSTLPTGYFYPGELKQICKAALRHAELNQDDQELVQRILMDADRLANLMPTVIIRAGQFRPHIPAIEFNYLCGLKNPKSTHHKPLSVLDDLRINMEEFILMLRIPAAVKLGLTYTKTLSNFIKKVELTNNQLGLTDINL